MPAPEVHALAGALRGSAEEAERIPSWLDRVGDVGNALQPAAEAFLDSHRTAARAIAGELDWLGRTVAAVADSWPALDRALLANRGPGGAG